MPLVEMLESRALFSATLSQTLQTDLSNLTADITAGKTDYQQYAPTLHADLLTLRAGVKAANQPADAPLLTKLTLASQRFFNTAHAEAIRLFSAVAVDARIGSADAILLSRHPGNTRVQAQVTASLTRLNTAATALLSKLGADGNTLSTASGIAAEALVAAYSGNNTVAIDVAALQSDGSTFLSNLGDSLGAVQNDLPQFLSDVVQGD